MVLCIRSGMYMGTNLPAKLSKDELVRVDRACGRLDLFPYIPSGVHKCSVSVWGRMSFGVGCC